MDLNRALESTLVVARHEYKYVAELETSFGEIPLVLCRGGEINQAILNIAVNAAHAIGSFMHGSCKGLIRVSTRQEDDVESRRVPQTLPWQGLAKALGEAASVNKLFALGHFIIVLLIS